MKFKPPKSDIQEVLYLLLTEGYVSCISASYMHGFRTRVSELRRKHNLVLDAKEMHSVNRNGNLFTYHEHRLALCSIKKATELYHKMTGNETSIKKTIQEAKRILKESQRVPFRQ